jgi:protease-4
MPLAVPLAAPLVLSPRSGDLTVVQAARRVLADRRAEACVVFIESPGGSATASEAIYQALSALGHKKPVVAALGAVAGSGGYYVAAACRQVVARPGSVTGSIGALWIKLSTGDLIARLGLHRQQIAKGRHAALHDIGKRYNRTQLRLVEKGIQRIDTVFRERVARGRRMDPVQLEQVAQGRVFTGAQAQQLGLVDALGGVKEATERARALAGLAPGAPLREVGAPGRRLAPPKAEPAPLMVYAAEGLRLLGGEGVYTLCPWTWDGG